MIGESVRHKLSVLGLGSERSSTLMIQSICVKYHSNAVGTLKLQALLPPSPSCPFVTLWLGCVLG